MTFDIDEYWGVSVTHGEKTGPKQLRASAIAFRRDTQEQVGDDSIGFGAIMNRADEDAKKKAAAFVRAKGQPKDWRSAA